jgi:UDP-glucose:(heptosyl)LPS alpha-1,3-glucosyltransferase
LKHPPGLPRSLASIGKALDPANWSYSLLERKQYLGAAKPTIVVNSEMVRSHFERFLGVPRESVRVLHSAIDPARFAAEDRLNRRHTERSAWRVAPEQPVGLFLAMNYRLKGLEPLLRSLPLSKCGTIAVAGHPKYSKYAKLAESLGVADRVRFLGHRPDPRDLYFAADYLVHPTFYDPCSLVALEALACGLPVVTTRYNGAAELLDDACGIAIDDPHDREELAAAIDRACDPAFLRTAPAVARQTAAKCSFENHYRGLAQLFDERRQLRRAA